MSSHNDIKTNKLIPKSRPVWEGYVVTLIVQALLTIILDILSPVFPIGKYAVPYLLAIMVIGYVYGKGPAILSFLTGFLTFAYWFATPQHNLHILLNSREGLTRLAAFLIGTVIVGYATISVRRARQEILDLLDRVLRQRAIMDAIFQNIPIGLAILDKNGRYLMMNQSMSNLNNTSAEEAIGKKPADILPCELAQMAEDSVNQVLKNGAPLFLKDFQSPINNQRFFDIGFYPVRLMPQGNLIGVGSVVTETTEQVLSKKQLQESYERERRISDALQSGLIGGVPESLHSFRFEVLYRAALDEARVGGDFYDVFEIDSHRIGVTVGDVSGKGLKAAMQVAMAKCSIRSQAYEHETPAKVLDLVNKTLFRYMDEESFATIFFGVLNVLNNTLSYANGGHAPVFVWKASENRASHLHPTGPLVGMSENVTYDEETIRLDSDDEIFISTDGLYELRCGSGVLDVDDLLSIYNDLKVNGLTSAQDLVEQVRKHCDSDLRDDLAVLRITTLK